MTDHQNHFPQLKYHGRYKGVASLKIEGGPGLSPINIGIIVSCSLIGLVILIQVGIQNINRCFNNFLSTFAGLSERGQKTQLPDALLIQIFHSRQINLLFYHVTLLFNKFIGLIYHGYC